MREAQVARNTWPKACVSLMLNNYAVSRLFTSKISARKRYEMTAPRLNLHATPRNRRLLSLEQYNRLWLSNSWVQTSSKSVLSPLTSTPRSLVRRMRRGPLAQKDKDKATMFPSCELIFQSSVLIKALLSICRRRHQHRILPSMRSKPSPRIQFRLQERRLRSPTSQITSRMATQTLCTQKILCTPRKTKSLRFMCELGSPMDQCSF